MYASSKDHPYGRSVSYSINSDRRADVKETAKARTMAGSVVAFKGVRKYYNCGNSISVRYKLGADMTACRKDKIVLVDASWESPEEALAYRITPRFVAADRTQKVLFKPSFLPQPEANRRYQFLYVTKRTRVLGLSATFTMRCPTRSCSDAGSAKPRGIQIENRGPAPVDLAARPVNDCANVATSSPLAFAARHPGPEKSHDWAEEPRALDCSSSNENLAEPSLSLMPRSARADGHTSEATTATSLLVNETTPKIVIAEGLSWILRLMQSNVDFRKPSCIPFSSANYAMLVEWSKGSKEIQAMVDSRKNSTTTGAAPTRTMQGVLTKEDNNAVPPVAETELSGSTSKRTLQHKVKRIAKLADDTLDHGTFTAKFPAGRRRVESLKQPSCMSSKRSTSCSDDSISAEARKCLESIICSEAPESHVPTENENHNFETSSDDGVCKSGLSDRISSMQRSIDDLHDKLDRVELFLCERLSESSEVTSGGMQFMMSLFTDLRRQLEEKDTKLSNMYDALSLRAHECSCLKNALAVEKKRGKEMAKLGKLREAELRREVRIMKQRLRDAKADENMAVTGSLQKVDNIEEEKCSLRQQSYTFVDECNHYRSSSEGIIRNPAPVPPPCFTPMSTAAGQQRPTGAAAAAAAQSSSGPDSKGNESASNSGVDVERSTSTSSYDSDRGRSPNAARCRDTCSVGPPAARSLSQKVQISSRPRICSLKTRLRKIAPRSNTLATNSARNFLSSRSTEKGGSSLNAAPSALEDSSAATRCDVPACTYYNL